MSRYLGGAKNCTAQKRFLLYDLISGSQGWGSGFPAAWPSSRETHAAAPFSLA